MFAFLEIYLLDFGRSPVMGDGRLNSFRSDYGYLMSSIVSYNNSIQDDVTKNSFKILPNLRKPNYTFFLFSLKFNSIFLLLHYDFATHFRTPINKIKFDSNFELDFC